MPTITASAGRFFVGSVMRADEPWTTRTSWPSPQPTTSMATIARPVFPSDAGLLVASSYLTLRGSTINRGANGGDIASQRDRHQAAADFVLFYEFDIGGLQRRVARFDGGDDAFGFDQSDCFTVCHVGSCRSTGFQPVPVSLRSTLLLF